MLAPQIIRLKNIIAFKVVVCALIGSLLLWLIPNATTRLKDSTQHRSMALLELKAIQDKVQFIKDSSTLVESTYNTYLQALKNPFNVSCIAHETLSDDLIKLAAQFKLRDKPLMQIQPIPTMEKFHNNPSVQILATNIDLSFHAQGFAHALGFTRAAYKMLPIYSLLNSINIEMHNVITPITIIGLTPGAEPQLIVTKLDISTRELKAEE